MPRTTMKKDGPDPVDIHVGARLRALRAERGLSQNDIAEACGITFQQVQKYERGSNRISASMMVRIALRLGVHPTELFRGMIGVDGLPQVESKADRAVREFVTSVDGRAIVLDLLSLSARFRHAVVKIIEAMAELAAA